MNKQPKEFIGTEGNPRIESRKEKIENRKLKSAKRIFTVSLYFLALVGIISIGLTSYNFFSTHGIQSPFRSPFYLKKVKIVSPVSKKKVSMAVGKAYAEGIPQITPTEEQIDYDLVADKIFRLESSEGKNDNCTSKGLFNGYGWRQNSFEWQCYKTREEVRTHVINRIKELTLTMDLETSLCYYNTGFKVKDCGYFKHYSAI